MKNRFGYFSARYLAAVLLGLFLLLLRAMTQNPVSAVFAPQCASPWELSKLAFWPLLAATALTGRMDGGVGKAVRRELPWLVLTPAVLVLVLWALSALEPGPGLLILTWMVALALSVALSQMDTSVGKGSVWPVLAVALGALYIVLTFLPPLAGPFLDPADVAAMATIPVC